MENKYNIQMLELKASPTEMIEAYNNLAKVFIEHNHNGFNSNVISYSSLEVQAYPITQDEWTGNKEEGENIISIDYETRLNINYDQAMKKLYVVKDSATGQVIHMDHVIDKESKRVILKTKASPTSYKVFLLVI